MLLRTTTKRAITDNFIFFVLDGVDAKKVQTRQRFEWGHEKREAAIRRREEPPTVKRAAAAAWLSSRSEGRPKCNLSPQVQLGDAKDGRTGQRYVTQTSQLSQHGYGIGALHGERDAVEVSVRCKANRQLERGCGHGRQNNM